MLALWMQNSKLLRPTLRESRPRDMLVLMLLPTMVISILYYLLQEVRTGRQTFKGYTYLDPLMKVLNISLDQGHQ